MELLSIWSNMTANLSAFLPPSPVLPLSSLLPDRCALAPVLSGSFQPEHSYHLGPPFFILEFPSDSLLSELSLVNYIFTLPVASLERVHRESSVTTLHEWNCVYSTLTLVGEPACRILGRKLLFLRNLEALLHCLLFFRSANENSHAILGPTTWYVT